MLFCQPRNSACAWRPFAPDLVEIWVLGTVDKYLPHCEVIKQESIKRGNGRKRGRHGTSSAHRSRKAGISLSSSVQRHTWPASTLVGRFSRPLRWSLPAWRCPHFELSWIIMRDLGLRDGWRAGQSRPIRAIWSAVMSIRWTLDELHIRNYGCVSCIYRCWAFDSATYHLFKGCPRYWFFGWPWRFHRPSALSWLRTCSELPFPSRKGGRNYSRIWRKRLEMSGYRGTTLPCHWSRSFEQVECIATSLGDCYTVIVMGRLDIVVSNVGWTRIANSFDLEQNVHDEDWDQCFAMNVKSHL